MKSLGQAKKIKPVVLFLFWILGTIIIFVLGAVTIGRLVKFDTLYMGEYTFSKSPLFPYEIVIISLLVGFFQWVFFRKYVVSLSWLIPTIIVGLLAFMIVTYYIVDGPVGFVINDSDIFSGLYGFGIVLCPGAIIGILASGLLMISIFRRVGK